MGMSPKINAFLQNINALLEDIKAFLKNIKAFWHIAHDGTLHLANQLEICDVVLGPGGTVARREPDKTRKGARKTLDSSRKVRLALRRQLSSPFVGIHQNEPRTAFESVRGGSDRSPPLDPHHGGAAVRQCVCPLAVINS